MLQVVRSAVLVALVAAAPQAAAQEFSASHLQAAEALLVLSDIETVLAAGVDASLRMQLDQNPDLAPFEDIMRSFLDEHLGWDALRDDFLRLYAESFTEPELRDILAFYRTETGQKAIRLMPGLMERGMALGQRAVLENQDELEALVADRVKRLSLGKAPATRPGSR